MKAFQPAIIGNFIRSVHSEKGQYHTTWHPTNSITRIYADDREILFFTSDDENAVPFCTARVLDHSSAKRTLHDLLLTLSGDKEAEK